MFQAGIGLADRTVNVLEEAQPEGTSPVTPDTLP
jgi:hypothetical protein